MTGMAISQAKALQYIQSLKKNLSDAAFKDLMSLFRRVREDEASIHNIRLILFPYPQHWEKFKQLCGDKIKDIEEQPQEDPAEADLGPSYELLPQSGEQKEQSGGQQSVLNTTVTLTKPRVVAQPTRFTVHEQALLDCEDEQMKSDLALGLADWTIDRVSRLVESQQKIGLKGELELLVARMKTVLGLKREKVVELLRTTDATRVLSLLCDARSSMLAKRERDRTEWARLYREHGGGGGGGGGGGAVPAVHVVPDSSFVSEIEEAHRRNAASYSHYAWLPGLLPPDVDLELTTTVNNDVSRLVNGWLSEPCRAWNYLVGNVLGLAPRVAPLSLGTLPPLFRTTCGDTAGVFYATEQVYMLLRLYVRLHQRIAHASATCVKLGKLSEYAAFLGAVAGGKKRAELQAEWSSLLRGGTDTIFELLERIQKHIRQLEKDSKAAQAIELHELEMDRSKGGRIDESGYYANAKFALFPGEAVYQFEAVESGAGKVAIKVRLFPDERSRTRDLNTVENLVGYYASPDWVEKQLLEADEELFPGVFLRRNRRKTSGMMADRRTFVRNGCLHRVTEKGRAVVTNTEDVFARFRRPSSGKVGKRRRTLDQDLENLSKKLKCC